MLGKKAKENDVTSPTPRPTRTSTGTRDVSVISKEMRILGDCETNGPLRIEGKITGDVRAKGLELAQSGNVSGDLSTLEEGKDDQVFLIDGRVDGTVRARQVEVRKTGVVLGGIDADQATIHGRVKGGILARVRLAMGETAVVEGDVRARRLALQEGGQVNGTILMGERAAIESSSAAPEAGGDAVASKDKAAEGETAAKQDAAAPEVGTKGGERSGARSGAKAE